MKRLDTDMLKNLLRQKAVSGAFVLYGNEDYLKNLSANRIISAFVSDEARSFDFTEIIQDFDYARLRDLTMALPMLSEKRVVLVRDADVYGMGADDAARMAKLISELPEECILIFVYITLPLTFDAPMNREDKKIKRAREVFADATAVSCDRLSESKAVAWITAMLKERNVAIERPIAGKLAELCGWDMYSMKNNCDMLSASGRSEVTEDMLSEITHSTLEQDSFALSNAIADGDYTEAYRLLEDLARKKVDPREPMPTVLSAFTAMYRVALAKEAMGDYRTLEGSFNYTNNSYPLRKASARIKGRSKEFFRGAVVLCADAERRLKREFSGYGAYYELIGGLAALEADGKI